MYVCCLEIFNEMASRFSTEEAPTFRERLHEAHPSKEMPNAEISPRDLRGAVLSTVYLYLGCPVEKLAAYQPRNDEPISPRGICDALLLLAAHKHYGEDVNISAWETDDKLRNFTMLAIRLLYDEIERASEGDPPDGEEPERTTMVGYRKSSSAEITAWDKLVDRIAWLKDVPSKGYALGYDVAMRGVPKEHAEDAMRLFVRLAAKTKVDRINFGRLAKLVANIYVPV